MSRKKTSNTGNSGWESDEEDLLNDGGITAFRTEDEQIDEEALLGLGDDDGGGGGVEVSYSDHDGMQENDFQQPEEEMLEIAVDEEEIQDLGVEEDDNSYTVHLTSVHEEDNEQLDYVDDLPQTDDVHVEYDDVGEDFSVSETDISQENSQISQAETSLAYSHNESNEQHTSALEEARESESESEDSDGEKHNRGRFKSERSNMVSIGKAKSRTDIPDTLEVSAEQQAQLDQFPNNRQRNTNRDRNDRGGRGGRNQRGGFQGGRQDQRGPFNNRQGPGPMPMHRGPPMRHQRPPFPHGQMGPPRPLMMGQDMGPRHCMPDFRDRPPGGPPFGGRPGVMGPAPLMRHPQDQGPRMMLQDQGPRMMLQDQGPRMRLQDQGPRMMLQDQGNRMMLQDQGNRMMLQDQGPRMMLQDQGNRMMLQDQGNRMMMPPHEGGFNMGRGQGGGMGPRMPGRMHDVPSSMQGPPGHPMQRVPQGQPPQFRPPGTPTSQTPTRPHNIHINPNFRGPAPGGPPASSIPSLGQPQPLFSQTVRMQAMGEGPIMIQDSPRPLMSSGFGQPQGFQQGPGTGGPGNQPGMTMGPGQQQPRFGAPQNQGMNQVMGSPPPGHPGNSTGGFPGQRLPVQNQQQFNPRFNNNGNQSPFTRTIRQSNSAQPSRFSPPRQGIFRGPSAQQQLRQQRPKLSPGIQGRLGIQHRGASQKFSTIDRAKQLTQKARATQLAKAEPQSGIKNITVVPLKRRSSDQGDFSISPKVARITGESAAEEPSDVELKRGLEQQKQLREMIKKRKEEARRRQAEQRRKELEARLATEGKSLNDLEGGGAKESGRREPDPFPQEGVQRITTVVSRGGKKQLVTKRPTQQRQQQQQQVQPQQQQQQYSSHQQYEPQGQLQTQQYQQPTPMFSPPPRQQQQQPRQTNPTAFSSPGFNQQQQQYQQVQQPFQPTRQPAPQQISPIRQTQSPFKHQQQHPQQPYQHQQQQQQHQQPQRQQHQQFQSPQVVKQFQPTPSHQYSQPPPVQHYIPTQSGDNAQNILGTVATRSAPQGMALGQVASPKGQAGRGQVARGRGQVVRGRGQVTRGGGQGRGVMVNASTHRVLVGSSNPSPQPASNRTVIPVGRGRGIPRGGSAPVVTGRTVIQRQVVTRPVPMQNKVGMSVGRTLQKVSIDNLVPGTQESTIRTICEAAGPLLDVVMIESAKKAIVTFASKGHAVMFAKTWNRRPLRNVPVTVTLLP